MKRTLFSIIGTAVLAMSWQPAFAQTDDETPALGCGTPFSEFKPFPNPEYPISLNDSVTAFPSRVEVVATGGVDDSANIQCAADFLNSRKLAIPSEFSIIELKAGAAGEAFSLQQQIKLEGFTGRITGQTIAGTRLEVPGGTFDCSAGIDQASLFRASSTTTVSSDLEFTRFTLDVQDSPCSGDTSGEFIALLVSPAAESCSARTAFTAVDRVNFVVDDDVDSFVTAIKVGDTPACAAAQFTPLGQLSVNRVEFSNWVRGIAVEMAGGAQVDSANNTFVGNDFGITIEDSNVNFRAFNDDHEMTGASAGVDLGLRYGIYVVDSEADAPNFNDIIITGNRFLDNTTGNTFGIAVLADNQRNDPSNRYGIAITNNNFDTNHAANTGGADLAQATAPVILRGFSGGTISRNRFFASQNASFDVDIDSHILLFASVNSEVGSNVGVPQNWAIVGNQFDPDSRTANGDVDFASGFNNIVGPTQRNGGAEVLDPDFSNYVLGDSKRLVSDSDS